MRPQPWSAPAALSPAEAAFVGRLKRRSRFFVFLREIRQEFLSAAFSQELATLYRDSPRGQPPVAPEQLALATLLQAYTGLSDAEVIEACLADRRWQRVLDCWETETPPFAQGTLVNFRTRLLAAQAERRLIERVLELAEATAGFGRQRLKLALDSSPLWGAGRVEDTVNLLGTALRRAVAVLAKHAGQTLTEQAAALGVPELGGTSLKGTLDLDWTATDAPERALGIVLAARETVEAQVPAPPAEAEPLLAVAHQVAAQDVVRHAHGQPTLRDGVAPDRRISIADGEQRHGRKSKAVRFDGYKRHAVRDLEQAGLIRAVAVTPGNRPDAEATPAVSADLAHQAVSVAEWHVDRAYLASALVRERDAETTVWCKPFPVRNGAQFPKTAFAFAADQQQLTCPAGVRRAAVPGQTVHFPAAQCDPCALRAQCMRGKRGSGRSITLHAEEPLLIELRAAQATPAGRAKLRERVGVEHTLARVGQVQGDVARYRGVRKQLFDTRRAAIIVNLQILDRLRQQRAQPPLLPIT
ncbi:MAG: transposase [Dehalococcoidia bacterium]